MTKTTKSSDGYESDAKSDPPGLRPLKRARGRVRVEAAPTVVPTERPGQAGGKRDANRRERAAALASAGLSLMIEHGIEAVSIDEIVKKTGVAKGSFYNYYRDKEEMVAAIIAPLQAPLREAFERAEASLLKAEHGLALAAPYLALASELAEAALAHRAVTRLYLQERRAPPNGARKPVAQLAREIDGAALSLSRAARDRGLTREGDPRVSAAVVVGAVEHIATLALNGDEEMQTPESSMELIAIVLDGVRAQR